MPSPSFFVAFTCPSLPDHLRPTLIVRVWGFRVVYGRIHLFDQKGDFIIACPRPDGYYPINGHVYSDCTILTRPPETPDFLWDVVLQQAVEIDDLCTAHVS